MKDDRNKRIAKNTGMLYFRSLICLFLSLYSSRLILQALGVEDFGIYNAVGGLAAMFWMVSSALSSAVGRYLNFEMGRQNPEGVNEVFSLSLNIMILLALFAALLAESLGVWFIDSKMTIPPERMEVAKLIFHLSVFMMVLGFVTIPFDSAIMAHERMEITAWINISEAVLKLGLAVLLVSSVKLGDKLALYAILMAVITLIVRMCSILVARFSFPECRIRLIWHAKRLGEMFRFAFWNFIASISNTFSGQGVNMALNVYHGPVLNTARGLTGTVSSAVSLAIFNFTVSVNPQITQSYAVGDIKRCRNLTFTGTRLAAYLILLIIIPLILEADFVLTLWLGSFPAHTVNFVRLSLIAALLYSFITLFSVAKMATGVVRNYQIMIAILSMLDFVLAWVVLAAGLAPEWIYVTPLVVVLAKIAATVWFVKDDLKCSIYEVFRSVYLPVAIVGAISLVIPFLLHHFMQHGWLRFIVVLIVSLVCTGFSVYFIGCNRDERQLLIGYAKSFLNRFQRKDETN